MPDEGERLKAERTLEPAPGAARVRFIDGDADYQTGSAVARSAGEGGGVDLDLPAVCSASLARTAAARALETGLSDRLTATLGPLEALRLEPGDVVTVEERSGSWRVARLDIDETPSATLERVPAIRPGENDSVPEAGEAASVPGAPLFRMIELPPLVSAETDGRPIAIVAAEPWRSMSVFAGSDALSMTLRGVMAQPTTVGTLVEPLAGGARHRWDETAVLMVRVEGRAPESRSARAVLAGANAVAIETGQGWELVQFRTAALIGNDLWRLSGLLRGQQGTEPAMRAGAAPGALVVLLDGAPTRADCPGGERGLPLVWRAG
ncbi:MAG TPA: phage tail protein, partial [Brevundimonas sp.]|nr:phage tail protein [Brevundimonas sp.]